MRLQELKDKIEKFTYRDKGLWLTGMIDENECRKYHGFDEQEIQFMDYSPFIYIRTFSPISPYDKDILGSIPYCMVKEDLVEITVPKFGELTKEEIEKAIIYVLNDVLDMWSWGFDIFYEGEKV